MTKKRISLAVFAAAHVNATKSTKSPLSLTAFDSYIKITPKTSCRGGLKGEKGL